MKCFRQLILTLIVVSYSHADASDLVEKTKAIPDADAIPYYTSFTPGIFLPRSAERHLISAMGFVKVVAIHKLAYDRRQDSFDYLGIDGEYEMPFGFESVYYHTFILRKGAKESDWHKAVIYRSETVGLASLFALGEKDFQKALIVAVKVAQKAEHKVAGGGNKPPN